MACHLSCVKSGPSYFFLEPHLLLTHGRDLALICSTSAILKPHTLAISLLGNFAVKGLATNATRTSNLPSALPLASPAALP